VSKLSDAEDALDEATEERNEAQANLSALEAEVAREHEDFGHAGSFRWCERPACRWVNRGND